MKTIVALIALICLFGVAGAQTMFMGEGYSASQMAFFNAPSSSTFEPDVQTYWGSYIASQQNISRSSATSDMDIWMNSFPLVFSTPLPLKTSSFQGNVSAPALGTADQNSQALTRDVNNGFAVNQVMSIPATSGSLTTSSGTGIPAKDATGKMLSQNIITFFNV
ncbi:MAG TPA: hypothetical protein VF300_04715 [Methanothrix sp.]